MSLHELAIRAAARTPEAAAVVDTSASLTYADLDHRANGMAHRLTRHGVVPGDRVVVWGEKSADFVAATQAVLRLGAAYVPADEASPLNRAAFLAEDCAAAAILTTADRLAGMADEMARPVTCLDLAGDVGADSGPVNASAGTDDLAYILYTSGSTGRPKGVSISHGNARAFVDWAVDEISATGDDRFANHAPLTFDLSVLDLYAAFSAGASVHLVPHQLAYAPAQLVDFLCDHKISVWYSVPSALTLMARDGGLLKRTPPDALRAILFAGEPFPISQVRELAEWTPARLLNLYGPTETNVCTFRQVTQHDLERDKPTPIGVASCGNRVWAQDEHGRPCSPGDEGELFVDGPTVMLGYWGRPRHTGPYGTGDLVRVLPDGSFDYIGRRDNMIKVRGNRVELGEIENVLAAHPDVAECAVVVSGSGVETRLIVYAVSRSGQPIGALALRAHCAARLPLYMVPDMYHTVPELPRTRNGKVNRLALIESRGAQ